jgi:hypothetical protein
MYNPKSKAGQERWALYLAEYLRRRDELTARAMAQHRASVAAVNLRLAEEHRVRLQSRELRAIKIRDFREQQLANLLKEQAAHELDANKNAKSNAPSVSIPVTNVPVDDTIKAVSAIENDSPSPLVLKKDADKGEINAPPNARFDANEPTSFSSGEAILQAHPSSSAPSAQVGKFKMGHSNTDDGAKPSARKDENNAQIDAQLDAQTPPSRLSSGGCVDLPQGHSSSSTTAPPEHYGSIKTLLSKGESPYVPPNAQFGLILTNVPVGEPPPPRGVPFEHSRPRTRGYLRAQLLQEVSK